MPQFQDGRCRKSVNDTDGYDEGVRTLVRIMWIPVLVVMLYSGAILWRRHLSQAPPAPQPARDPLAQYGRQVRVLQFYTSTGAVAAGSKLLLCYGVVNAKEVRLDPPIGKVWPAMSRCFDVRPERSTRYTLTAVGADQKVASASLQITVER